MGVRGMGAKPPKLGKFGGAVALGFCIHHCKDDFYGSLRCLLKSEELFHDFLVLQYQIKEILEHLIDLD